MWRWLSTRIELWFYIAKPPLCTTHYVYLWLHERASSGFQLTPSPLHMWWHHKCYALHKPGLMRLLCVDVEVVDVVVVSWLLVPLTHTGGARSISQGSDGDIVSQLLFTHPARCDARTFVLRWRCVFNEWQYMVEDEGDEGEPTTLIHYMVFCDRKEFPGVERCMHVFVGWDSCAYVWSAQVRFVHQSWE